MPSRKTTVKKDVTSRTTKIVEREVAFLTDPEASFISLVKHGANQEPFLVIKSRKGGTEDMPGRIIQRVIVSKELPEKVADEYLKKVRTDDEKEYDGYLVYDQVGKELCDPKSFGGIKLDADGKVFAVTAELKDGAVLKDAQPLMEEGKITEVFKTAIPWEIHYDIVDEMYAMQSALMGTLNQTQADIPWKKKAIQKAIGFFKDFMTMALDNVEIGTEELAKAMKERGMACSAGVVSPEAAEATIEKVTDAVKQLKELAGTIIITPKEAPMEQLFKSREEVAEFIGATIAGIEAKKAESTATQKARKDAEDAVAAEKAALTATLKTMSDGITALTAEVATLKAAVPASGTEVAEGDGEQVEAAKERKAAGKVEKTDKTKVFKGLFLRGGLETTV